MKLRVLTLCALFATLYSAAQTTIDHWETAVYAGDTWKYFRGTQAPNGNWNNLSFSANSWSQGPGGIGYGDADDGTSVQTGIASLYIRRAFTVTDTSVIAKALLDIDYDDAFVAYLNGVEVARNNVGSPANYNTLAFGDHEAQMYQGGTAERYEIPKSLLNTCLVNGQNLLAIQIHNVSTNSGDLSSNSWLTFGIEDQSNDYGNPPSWFQPPFEFISSTLPIIVINTNGQSIVDDPRIICNMGIIDNGPGMLNHVTDTFNNYDGKITIEYRGSSTQGFPKKQFGMSTVDSAGNELNVSLLGFPKENDWILNAPYTDKTLMREYLIYNWAREMGRYATRTRYCEMVIDGQYQGVYMLFEKVKWDDDRVDVEMMDTNDNAGDSLTGGYVFKVDKTTGSGGGQGWSSTITTFQGQPKNGFFQYHYPQADMITNPQKNYISNYVNNFETNLNSSNYNNPDNGYHKFIDVESFIDFFLLNEISKNVDGYRLSTFLHKQRASRGGKLYAGPVWDFNITLGNADYCAGDSYTGWALDFPCDQSVIPFWWHRLQQDSVYTKQLNCRWNDLRNGILSTANVMARIDSIAAVLNEPQTRNYTIWPILGTYVWPNNFVGSTYQQEVDYLKTWLTQRLNWMDDNMPQIGTPGCGSAFGGGSIIVSEVNYNSNNTIEAGDWVELKNTTGSPINVSGWVFRDSNVANSYTIPANTTIPAGGYLVLAENTAFFNQIHPTVTNYVGPFNFGLGNSGDQINLFDNLSNPVLSFSYLDSLAWPKCADGLGFTLESVDDVSNPALPASWHCGCLKGSPGTGYVPCNYPIVFSEINFNSADTADSEDWVELHNTTGQAINISGYSFKDDDDTLAFVVPNGTMLDADGYLVIYKDNTLFTQRHPLVANKMGPFEFGLSGSGDACRLYNTLNKLVLSVVFDDDPPFPDEADGLGKTMELVSETGPMCDGTNWFAGCPEGSPGGPYVSPCNVGVIEDAVSGVLVYPNPFNDVLMVQWNSIKTANTIVELYDATGKLISGNKVTTTPGINRYSFNNSALPAGMYMLRLVVEGQTSAGIKVLKN